MTAIKSPWFWVRTGVSVLLLTYVFMKVGWGPLWEQIRTADVRYLAAYLALGLAATVISAVKWRVLCRPFGFHTRLPRLFALYMVGYFFNHVLPTSVGGDVVRGYELGRTEGHKARAMATVFVERFTGLTVLMILAVMAVAFDTRFRSRIEIVALVGLAAAGYVVLAWMILSPLCLNIARRLLTFRVAVKALGKVGNFQEAVLAYRHHRRELAWAMFHSVLFYITAVYLVYVGALTFGHHVPMLSLLAAVPIMLVVFMIPISLGGIGLQEWAYYAILALVGVPAAVGLSLGLLYRARAMLFGLIGGLLFPLTAGGRMPAPVPIEPVAANLGEGEPSAR
jgi:glycosyltransferase 2 family protein